MWAIATERSAASVILDNAVLDPKYQPLHDVTFLSK